MYCCTYYTFIKYLFKRAFTLIAQIVETRRTRPSGRVFRPTTLNETICVGSSPLAPPFVHVTKGRRL